LVGQQGFSGGEIIKRFMGVLLIFEITAFGIFLIPILIGYLLGIKTLLLSPEMKRLN
jgi:hypothetical protein